MKKIGGYMFFFGLGSIILNFMNMEFVLLSWIDLWGPGVAWAIRGGLAVIGGLLWVMGNRQEA